jgi:hypothetical protein
MQHALIYRETLDKLLDDLPEEKVLELIDFASFLRDKLKNTSCDPHRIFVKAMPVEQLQMLSGTVAWGGDALDDTERLYE